MKAGRQARQKNSCWKNVLLADEYGAPPPAEIT
jgi:hypothetical protein